MKTKTLYLITFLLAVFIIFTLIYSKSKISELNQSVPAGIRVEAREERGVNESAEPVFFHKEAITVIKPAQGKESPATELDKINDFKDQQDLALSSKIPAASGGSKDQGTEKAAGVTTSGKYPPKEKIQELNSQGIIIY